MNTRAYYAKRLSWLVVVVVAAWSIWAHQEGLGRAMERQVEPARGNKGTFMQRETAAMEQESEPRGRR